jgi:hypothetical protein
VGATPGVGEVFELGARGDAAHGVALGGIVDIAADGATIFLHGESHQLKNVCLCTKYLIIPENSRHVKAIQKLSLPVYLIS